MTRYQGFTRPLQSLLIRFSCDRLGILVLPLLLALLVSLSPSNALAQQHKDIPPKILYGDVNTASDYSFEHKCFVILLSRGKDAKRSLEEYAALIEEKIFFGDRDIPIVYVLDKESFDGVNAVVNCYINGKMQGIGNTKKHFMLLSTLDKNADIFSLRYLLSRHGYDKVDLLNKVLRAEH